MWFSINAVASLIAGDWGLALGNGLLAISDIMYVVRQKRRAGKTTYMVIDRIAVLGFVMDVCGLLLLFSSLF